MSTWDLGTAPIEHRLLGMDRRLFLPTLAIIAITVVLAVVIPAINASIPANEYAPGDVQRVRDMVEFEPAAGWMPDGVPAPSAPALRIFRDGISMTIAPGAWDGSADELLTSILDTYGEYHTEGDRRTFELPSGIQGAAQNLYGVGNDGAVFALVAPDTVAAVGGREIGVRMVIRGPAELLPEQTEEIAAMIRSFRSVSGGEQGE